MATLQAMVASRKNSKFLAKFIHDYIALTDEAQLLCMYNGDDTWNKSLIDFFSRRSADVIRFFPERLGYGRSGLHLYYELMLDWFTADWLVFWCEDHQIIVDGWDSIILKKLSNLDPMEPYIAIPGWDNIGSVNHVLSRGYVNALGGRLAGHGNLDSFINDVASKISQDRIIQLPVLAHDMTHDAPPALDDYWTRVDETKHGVTFHDYYSPEVQEDIQRCAELINNYSR